MPVPVSGGSCGTSPRIGQRTRSAISSTASRSPAAIDRRAGATGPRQPIEPGRVARSRPAHPGLEHPADAVAVEQEGQAGDVVLVRVRQDDRVDPPVPRRDPPIELDEQPVGIRPAIDQQAAAARALDEDGVALPDVEDRDPRATPVGRVTTTAPATAIATTRLTWPTRARDRRGCAAGTCVEPTGVPGAGRHPAARPRHRPAPTRAADAADHDHGEPDDGRRQRPARRPTAGSSATLANGRAAAASTIPTISRRATQPGAASDGPDDAPARPG